MLSHLHKKTLLRKYNRVFYLIFHLTEKLNVLFIEKIAPAGSISLPSSFYPRSLLP